MYEVSNLIVTGHGVSGLEYPLHLQLTTEFTCSDDHALLLDASGGCVVSDGEKLLRRVWRDVFEGYVLI